LIILHSQLKYDYTLRTIAIYFFTILFIAFELNSQTDFLNYTEMIEWREIGPYRGGRSCAVTGVTGKPNLFYFGATGGGVWKTEDGGRSWSNISDGFFGGSIGAITVAPSDKNVIYVGGGEKTVRGNVSYGYGVWKSVDAGKTWFHCGLEDSRHISRIRVHPNNPDIVYAAVMGDLFKDTEERGVYKSVDGGKTWVKVLFSSASAGAVDLIIDPTNHRILYASTWNIRRTPYSLSSGGADSKLLKSVDEGETWTDISGNKGLPEGIWGISGIAVSPLDGERLYAIIENENGGVFKSDDGGETWKKVNDERKLRQRAWYYSRIYADTEDKDKLYVVNVSYHTSDDGGKTFTSRRAPHGDHHDLWIDPTDNQRMIIGDDGGAQVTYDGGDTWTTYHNQPTAQFYRVTTDNHFPYRIYAAQQDNSTIRILHRSDGGSITEDHWESTAGGESAHIAVAPEDNEIVYGGSYGGFLTRKNHRLNKTRAINVYPDNPMGHGAEGMKYRFQWNFPIFFSKHDPNKLYTCSQHVHMSTDEGHSWQVISPDLTRNEVDKLVSSGGPITKDNTGVEYYATIFAAQESSLKEGLIWVGSDDGRIHVTQNGGASWEDVTADNMPKYLMINCIEPSPSDAGTCYLAGTQYKLGDYQPYLYKTTDFGKTWKKITNGIPADHFTRAIRVDPNNKGILYAGTESGMYISIDDGLNWQSFQKNLPIVPITDLTFKGNDLIAATQGRGLWIIDNADVIAESVQLDEESFYLFDIEDSYRMPGFQNKKTKGAGMNPPSGAIFNFYMASYQPEKDTVTIKILDEVGGVVDTWSNHASEKSQKLKLEQGANQWSWDLSYPKAKKFDKMILWWGSLNGPKAIPGGYSIVLKYNKDSIKKDFKVLKDPSSEGSVGDMREQFNFISTLNDKINESHESIEDIRKLRKQMNAFKDKTEEEEVITLIAEIDGTMSQVEEALYQTKNRSGQDPLNFPIKLTNKLAHLNSLCQMGFSDYPPTASMYEVRDILIQEIDEVLKPWIDIKSNKIDQLNELIRIKSVDLFDIN
jgi:photosystem II stability/assembly factor-like uncharacterized protein